MLNRIHKHRPLQLVLGLLFGVCFGFLLQRGGVTRYEIIMGQLLLVDWTVVKIIFTAVVVGTLGVHILISLGLAQYHKKPGSWGRTAIGGLIFGLGFGVLGYCPGTGMGAVGQGSIDALVGGVGGLILGSASFAAVYPYVKDSLLEKGSFGKKTLADLLHLSMWRSVGVMVAVLVAFLLILEVLGW
ncbi:MAG: YeeE/YedE thiosulfate transporter family protein [Candidatus Sumerlaeota bacterium]